MFKQTLCHYYVFLNLFEILFLLVYGLLDKNSCTEISRSCIRILGYLIRVVGCCSVAVDAVCCHDSSQVISLHQQFKLLFPALIINVNDGPRHFRDSLNHHLHTHHHHHHNHHHHQCVLKHIV